MLLIQNHVSKQLLKMIVVPQNKTDATNRSYKPYDFATFT